MRSPYSLITSSSFAGANGCWVAGHALGAGRFVTRYQVLRSGKVCGSVVATTARSVLSGPYGPATISNAHHCCVLPSRKVLVIGTHLPGWLVLSQPASCATSCREPATSSGCHHAGEGLSAITYGTPSFCNPPLKPRSSP